jgi:hypothetical protein
VHQRLAGKEAGIVDEELRREVIHAVEHHIVVADNLQGIACRQTLFIHHDVHVGIERLDLLLAGQDLGTADIRRVMDDLTLEIAQVHDIAIDEPDRADSGGCQVQGCRRTKASGADHEHLRLNDLLLSFSPDLGKKDMAAVAINLCLGELHGGSRYSSKKVKRADSIARWASRDRRGHPRC